VDDALCLIGGATPSTEWLDSRPGRDRVSVLGLERFGMLSCGSGRGRVRIVEFAGLQHRMHYHRQLAGNGHRSAFEADPFTRLQTLGTKRALTRGARQDHRRGFVKKAAQLMIVSTGDVAVIVDLPR
jgi:hypothetical protein